MWYKSANQKIGIPTVYESWIIMNDKYYKDCGLSGVTVCCNGYEAAGFQVSQSAAKGIICKLLSQ